MLDDLGLIPTLIWHLERYRAQTGIQVAFQHNGVTGRFQPEIETAAYRIVQEALTNVARHAGTLEAFLCLWADQQILNIHVEDKGRGFVVEEVLANGDASGLLGIQERVGLLNGQITIHSRPGSGTSLVVELPLKGEEKTSCL